MAHVVRVSEPSLRGDRFVSYLGDNLIGVDARSDIAGKVVIEPGARIIEIQVPGPAIIGSDALVQESFIGPYTSLEARCILRNSEVEDSLICPGTQILDAHVRIAPSVLGHEVTTRGCLSRPTTQKFVMGDQSLIELA